MRHQFHYPITETEAGMTVEELLLARGYSRRLIIDLKKSPDYLTIGGVHTYVTRRLQLGDVLQVLLPEVLPSPGIVPTPMELDILYEDEDLIVLNKAANLPIHPSQGNYSNTLANGMAWYFAEKGEPFVYRVINRLDRDTTGLLILAKHALSACILSDMVQKRQIHRTYLAAVSGDVRELAQNSRLPGIFLDNAAAAGGFSDGFSGNVSSSSSGFSGDVGSCGSSSGNFSGSIDAPIARVDGSTIERQVDFVRGEPARTHFQLLSCNRELDASILMLKLETGRTHQIRVHCKYMGHPLLGDFLYNPDYRYIHRQSLHSWKLEFCHPISGRKLNFVAEVPEDMQVFVGTP
ncbi:MAG: RluA family pseudouridine synthase [Eubacteriales bacterium]|nr:RluA family pseudouridine synthase [Eubacteriales bacterium]